MDLKMHHLGPSEVSALAPFLLLSVQITSFQINLGFLRI